jgi:hypothetical protein
MMPTYLENLKLISSYVENQQLPIPLLLEPCLFNSPPQTKALVYSPEGGCIKKTKDYNNPSSIQRGPEPANA